jgi:archaellum component FlaF (FlaF/FlaG flagellin family)
MGLSIAISGGIVTFSIVYAMMSFPAIVDDTTKISASESQMANSQFLRLQTNINISNLQDQNGNSAATFQVTNTGNTVLWNYDNFDVIITYEENATNNPILTETLRYANSCSGLTSDQWCISHIQNDNIHPGLLDPEEIATINAQPAHPTESGGDFIVEFGTDNGVTTSESVKIS